MSDRVIGIITDRDICMCALFKHRPLSELPVSEAMSNPALVIQCNQSVAQAEKIMGEAQVRRLPVVNPQGILLGMLSLADLARVTNNGNGSGYTRRLPDSQVSHTLAAICSPRAFVPTSETRS